MDSRTRLRVLGQANLGAWIEVAEGRELWSIQHDVGSEMSVVRARLTVPSCNASGKTFIAGRLALAFYDAFTPGTPCNQCDPHGTKGGCRGSKVILTSSKETHLLDNLGGELRMAIARMAENGVEIPGTLPPKELLLYDSPDHFIRGHVATKEEGFQGYHAAHKLIIGDEATSVSQEVSRGITSLLATADTRLLLIFNPTTNDTYAAAMTRSERFKTIKITAFDTPHFTGEHVPEGANLVTPLFLEDLEAQGMGPGSYEWTTRVLADFWDQGEASLILPSWIEQAKALPFDTEGQVAMGVDLASYGTDECAIGIRRANTLEAVHGYPAQHPSDFIIRQGIESPVAQQVSLWHPWYIVFDADGIGAGAVGEFERLHEWAIRAGYMEKGSQIIGFRGGKKVVDHYQNMRSGWWWALRNRFQSGRIPIRVRDPKLDAQLQQMTYAITEAGAIKVESKDSMKRRGYDSPDRADVVMYAYAFSEDLPDPNSVQPKVDLYAPDDQGLIDHSPDAMWARHMRRMGSGRKIETNPVTGLSDEL